MTNSVGFYQLSKLSCIPITLIIETLLNRRQQLLTFSMLLSLSFIMGGMSFIVINELSLSGFGLIWATLAVVATSLAQVLFGPLQKELGMNSIQLLFHTSPVLTVGSYFLIPLFEDTTKLLNTDITGSLVAHILASSIMAVMLNITNYFVLSITSPLTYQILNHCKTIMVILSGILFFDEYPSTRVTIGMSLVIVGVIIYSEENRQQQLRRQDKNSILPEVMNTTESKPSKQEDNSLPQLKARNSDINLPSNQTPFVQDRLVHSQYSANISNNMSSSDTKYVTTVGSVSPPILSRHNSNSSNFDYSGDINRKATVYVTSSTDAQSG